ncbi:SubName: Full=Uncharacterized protein {ECO:0000313/EMBL:CCA72538.1} [Serendipita indica DSM 11827]|uniref:Small ribosomal subunit protein uS10 domain-containing protein n=1 Tax=Serendipita indica (strain DSM 11827) TaxID=1109443 RepID=G4TMI9_SERID|nr:SubName: Full=Uncharacterized protein {ECO:0000313/EMBL:CCA72538.1} [Serendipita indica DSM 11827]CCA72538.1 hypothetical protein PIIN_06475 [Serendipita indica DSM 11827]
MSLSRSIALTRSLAALRAGTPLTRLSSRTFSTTALLCDSGSKTGGDFRKRSRYGELANQQNGLGATGDSEEAAKELQRAVQNAQELAAKEDLDYDILAGKLQEAIEELQKEQRDRQRDLNGAPTSAVAEETLDTSSEGTSDSVSNDGQTLPDLSTLEASHAKMRPAERVVDLLDRLSIASQPLLQRIIQSTDKDFDQLLSEVEAHEALAKRHQDGDNVPSLPSDLVQSPNSLSWDRTLRRSSMSPTRAMLRGRKIPLAGASSGTTPTADELIAMQEEGEFDLDDELAARAEFTKWMEQGAEVRAKGGVQRLWNDKERKQLARLLETITQDEDATEASGTITEKPGSSLAALETESVAFDMARMEELTNPTTRDSVTERWYTTTPSIGLTQPSVHPRTHSIPVASLHFRSHFPHLLDMQTHLALHSAYGLGIPVSKPAHLPTQRTLITVLKSSFVHKKSMENWERKVHKRAIKVWDCNADLLTGWLAWLERNSVQGVGMRVTRWEWVDVGHLESASKPSHNIPLLNDAQTAAPSVSL